MKRLFIIIVTIFMLTNCASVTVRPIMKGDCVDRAVEIRQQLRADGIEAEIILGIITHPDGSTEGHAWIRYIDPETGEEVEIKNY